MTNRNTGALSQTPGRSPAGGLHQACFRTQICKWLAGFGLTALAASAATFVPNYLTYEYYPGVLQADGTTYLPLRADVEAGTQTPSTTGTTVGSDKSGSIPTFEAGSNFADNYVNRIYGYFVPPVTGNYVFFIAADDDADLFLSTDATAANKHLIAQEAGWSPIRSWTAIGGSPSTAEDKRSDSFSTSEWPGGGAAISLTKGQKYYIEAVHHEGTGGDNLAVTYKLAGDADPANGSAPQLAAAVIGSDFATVPSTAPNLSILTQPLGGTYYIGGTMNLSLVAQTDSAYPISYQWTKNGTNIPGANSASYLVGTPAASDAGTYAVSASVPSVGGNLVTVTSSNAVVTIQPAPVVTGKLKYLYFPGAGSVASVESGTLTPSYAGTTVGSDSSGFISSAESGSNFADTYGNQISGFFIPPTTADYVFFLCSDDQSDLWLSTDENPANKKLIAQETVWSNPRQWTSSGGSSDLTAKRSDQFTGTQWSGNTIHLTAGTKYYLEADHVEGGGGDNLGVTYALATDDPSLTADGTASRLTGSVIGVYVPPVIAFTGISPTYKTLSFGVQDVSPSILDPSSIQLTFDNQAVVPTASPKGTNGITTFTYSFPTNLAQGSKHSYTIIAKDAGGTTINSVATFTVPTQFFPKTDLPGPTPAGTNWASRFIFNAGNMVDVPSMLRAVMASASNDFTGTVVDVVTNVVNWAGTGVSGLFGNNNGYPDAATGDPSWTGDNFVNLNIGHLNITEEGDYTFGTHTDDGFALRIRGGQAISVSGSGQIDPVDPEVVLESAPTGDSNTRAVYHLKKGVYRIEFVWYEDGGGDAGELYAAKGAFVNESDTTSWKLVGDSTPSQQITLLGVDANGWSVISSDPGGDVLTGWTDAQPELDAATGPAKNYDYLNVGDPDTNGGVLAFPKNTVGTDDDNYTMKATATLVVPQDGTYIIGFNSDDGAYMKVAGQTFTAIQQNNTGLSVINGDTVTCDCPTGDSGTTATITLKKGNYPIEMGSFEIGGGSFLAAHGVLAPALPITTGDMPFLAKNAAGSVTNTPAGLQLTAAAADGGTGGGGNTGSGPSASITVSGNSLTINSSAPGTVQATSALSSSTTWTDLGAAPQTVQMTDKARFFRIKQ
jgi:hypothetical protein